MIDKIDTIKGNWYWSNSSSIIINSLSIDNRYQKSIDTNRSGSIGLIVNPVQLRSSGKVDGCNNTEMVYWNHNYCFFYSGITQKFLLIDWF